MFEGITTALITPFVDNAELRPHVDWTLFRKLIRRQFKRGADGVVTSGTTGESPTLNFFEHDKTLYLALEEKPAGKFVIAGTGSNSTYEAFKLTQYAKFIGADGVLAVVPYYNKPSQVEIYKYFRDLDQVGIPIIAYDVPSRTVVGMNARTTLDVMCLSNVVALKDATGRVNCRTEKERAETEELAEKFPEGKGWLSGNDEDTYKLMRSCKGRGVISVITNLDPAIMIPIVHGSVDDARRLQHEKYSHLMQVMFIESNPKPVKEAMHILGITNNSVFRRPLIGMSPENREKLEQVLFQYNLRI